MDAIRGCAAILVMLGHSRDLFFQSLNAHRATVAIPNAGAIPARHEPRPQISMGHEAVMIFFVLSGYLVGGSVLRSFQRNSWSWMDYLTKRLTRLWMVLLPALVLTVALDHLGLRLFPESTGIYHGPVGQDEVRPNLIHSLAPHIIAGNAFFLQNILVMTPGTNRALWSLSNEFWYYLIFPLLVFVFWRSSTVRTRLVAALLATALLFFIGKDEAILFPTWLIGAAIALLPLRLTERSSWWLSTSLGLLLLPVMILVRRLPLDLPLAQTIIALYFSILLYVLLNRTKQAKRGMYDRTATLLSDLSYPLYLVHLPILVFQCACFNRPWHQWTKTPAHFGLMLSFDTTTLVAAYLFHVCFQKRTDTVRVALLGLRRRQQHFRVVVKA